MPRLPLALVALSLLVLPGCFFTEAAFKETRDYTLDHQPGRPIEIFATNGSIELRCGESEAIEVSARLKATSAERLAAAEVRTGEGAEGSLRIDVAWPEPGRRSNEGCSFVVRVPDADGVRLETSNGRLTVSGANGLVRLRTSNGAIRVDGHRGAVQAKTSNGSVKISGDLEETHVRSSNGRIEIAGVNGHLDARTSNGSVSVVLGELFCGSLECDTSNGRIRTSVPREMREVQTSRTHAFLAFDRDGPASEITTSNGSITVR